MKLRFVVLFFISFWACCFNGATAQFYIHFPVNQPQKLVANGGGNKSALPGAVVTLGGNPIAKGGTPPYSWSWSPGKFLNDSTLENPELVADSARAFYLAVSDQNHCSDTDCIEIVIITGVEKYAENAYTQFVRPNPTYNGVVFIDCPECNIIPAILNIYNADGKNLATAVVDQQRFKLNLNDFRIGPGAYIVTLQGKIPYKCKLLVL